MILPTISRRARALLAAAAAATLGASALAPAADAAFPGRNGPVTVAFGFGCDGSMLSTMQPDGSDRKLLTPSACNDDNAPLYRLPDWSADGQRLIALNGANAPVLLNADGSNPVVPPLAATPYFGESRPSLSPDGKRFVYTRMPASGRAGARSQIWIAGVDGSGDHAVRFGSDPRWSPDGKRIAYAAPTVDERGKALRGGTYLMSAKTGKRIRRIGPRAAWLDWAPAGDRLVYTAYGTGGGDLYVMRADGRGTPRRLTATRTRSEYSATWSPNGRRIVFVRSAKPDEEEVRYEIWTMSARGGDAKRIYKSADLGVEDVMGIGPAVAWQPLR
jgi:Tol biopolymer transport system component